MRLEDIIPSYSSNNTFTSAFSLPVVNPANENSAIYTNIYEPGKLTDSKNMLCILYITMLYLFSILYKFIFQQLDLLHQEQNLLQKLASLLQMLYHLLQKLCCLLQITAQLLQIFKSIIAFAFVNGLPSASITNKYWICI